ncbi:hypothetical protein CH373_01555 [Leptospira perolatii]|uniref:Protein tyrosine phosphatase n=1 Tax=Leptospira perolatii TaxID=2023191 RepID=A0A2M9ZSY1_9LEPT|nr:hypothetical protein CH360_01555 [Leptospira perolatii]PJZ75190.1 hypothetical protein CH373_01555 [Leptospira perolatii]
MHGDLNGRNIILDAQKNVWLIDFFHTHRGHVLRDLIKLESDILYIFTKITEEEYNEAFALTDLLYSTVDLASPPNREAEELFSSPKIRKAFRTIRKLRSFYAKLIRLDRDPYQLHVATLRYSVHTLSFDESSTFQKIWALYTSSILCEKVKLSIQLSKRLRIDFLHFADRTGKLGMTLLPGRKDRNRNLQEDIATIKEEKVHTLISLLTENEYENYGVQGLHQTYVKEGFTVHHLPILDQRVPDSEGLERLLDKIDSDLYSGKNVLVHCVGGLGRSGTIAAAYMIRRLGYPSEEAIRIVRQARSERAIESKEQENFLRSLTPEKRREFNF